jgi:UDP-N-acetylmuramoyl-tripeptide--D-alanyl-D-alanine ligase
MVGVRAAEVVDELVTVGELGKLIAVAARDAGLNNECIAMVADAQEAIEYLKSRLGERDVALIKGSHGVRMDRIVSALEFRQ